MTFEFQLFITSEFDQDMYQMRKNPVFCGFA
jgi:hypothetical protein